MHALAERFLDAVLSSASVDLIGRDRWWPRAVSALETGAAVSSTFRQATAKTCRRMQIDTLHGPSAATVADLATVLDDPAMYARWRTVARRDAIAIAAQVRNMRAARHQNRTTPTPGQDTTDD